MLKAKQPFSPEIFISHRLEYWVPRKSPQITQSKLNWTYSGIGLTFRAYGVGWGGCDLLYEWISWGKENMWLILKLNRGMISWSDSQRHLKQMHRWKRRGHGSPTYLSDVDIRRITNVKRSFGQLLPGSRLVHPKSKKSSKNGRRSACMNKGSACMHEQGAHG